jgi:starch synthase (maltosyl-transferring)
MTKARDNIIIVVVNLDPSRLHHSYVYIPLGDFGPMDSDVYQVHDLLTDARYLWRGDRNYVELNPAIHPAHIFRVRRWLAGEKFV